MIDRVWLIPLLPFAAALINGLFGRKLRLWSGRIAVASMLGALAVSLIILGEVIGHTFGAGGAAGHGAPEAGAAAAWTGQTVPLWQWISVGGFEANVALRVDQLTAVMLIIVSLVGSLVFIYATGYMKEKVFAGGHGHGAGHGDDHDAKHGGHDEEDFADAHGFTGYERAGAFQPDPGYHRFFAYLSLFAGAMFTLVLADNFPLMFVGWEGVGLCSYLLIGYYFDRPFEQITCADAGKKAFVVNRVGDWAFLLGMFMIWWHCGTLRFEDVFARAESGGLFPYGGWVVTAITLLLFIGATGKSAQIPLFIWLPDAMAGPTPVSALIHAATMVTAGVYMVARCNVLYMLAPETMAVVAIVGALTAFVAASIGLTQRGIKKVLAYSTVSQLGYMFMGLGVGAFAAGIFHVFTHAFFKGCLFLAAGSIIHALHHEEDLFRMGALRKRMPLTWIAYAAATLAIAGFPLTAGFFSKDEILFKAFEGALPGFGALGKTLWGIGAVAALFTAIYMGRSLFLAFHGDDRTDPHVREHISESPRVMTWVLIVLGFFSLVAGFLNVPEAFGGSARFHHFLSPVTDRGLRLLEARGITGGGGGAEMAAGAGEHPATAAGAAAAHSAAVAAAHKAGHSASHGLEVGLALFSAAVAIIGLAIAWIFYGSGISERARSMARALGPLYQLSANRWWWDDIYNSAFVKGTWRFASAALTFDRSLIDGFLHGLARLCRGFSLGLRRLQSGQVQAYALAMLLGVVMCLLYFVLGMK